MNIEKTARGFVERNAPSPELMNRTLCAMEEARLAQFVGTLPKKKHIGRRRFGFSVGAVAAVMVLLMGTNMAFPAFAESLPFIGGVFKTFNRGIVSENLREAQDSLNNYAMPAGENTVQVPAGGIGQKPLTVSVDQVYYDGVYVYAGLVMELEGCSDIVYSNNWGDYYCVYLDGEPQIHWDENTREYVTAKGFIETIANDWWQKVESGKYISQRGFRVPEKYQGLDRLNVTLCSQGIDDGVDGWTGHVNNTPFQLSFTVEKNDAVVRKIQEPMEINGITFLSAEAGPAGSTFTFEVSGKYNNPASVIRFDDGRNLGFAGAGKTAELADGGKRQTWFMGGVRPEETRKVVLGLMDKNDTKEWIAVFVLDFQAGTVEAGTPEDIQEPPYACYVCGTQAVENLTDGLLLASFSYSEEKNSLILFTRSGYRDLTVELWQDGRQVGNTVSGNDPYSWEQNPSYREYVLQADGTWTENRLEDLPLNQYWIDFENMRSFDPGRPASVRVVDRDTNEVLLEQDMEWNQPRSNDPRIVHPEVEDDITEDNSDGAVSSQAQ